MEGTCGVMLILGVDARSRARADEAILGWLWIGAGALLPGTMVGKGYVHFVWSDGGSVPSFSRLGYGRVSGRSPLFLQSDIAEGKVFSVILDGEENSVLEGQNSACAGPEWLDIKSECMASALSIGRDERAALTRYIHPTLMQIRASVKCESVRMVPAFPVASRKGFL